MADSKTLHELKVAIRVALGGYKKDMGSVKAETKKMRDSVEGETAKITQAMNRVSTSKAKKELESLTKQLVRQKEQITRQENIIQSLRNKYDGLISGVVQDKGTIGLEKQLRAAEKEFSVMQQKMNSLLDQYEIFEQAAKNGGDSEAFQEISRQVDELEPKYEALGRKVDQLKEKLEQVRMNPEASSSVQELMARIDAETAKLERLKNEAGTTKEKLDAVMHSKSPPGTIGKLEQISTKLKSLAATARNSAKATTKGFSEVHQGVGRLNSRLKGIFSTVLVFSVLRNALSGFRTYLSSCLNTNREFAASLNAIKTNLQVSFAAIYTAALPAINALMRALTSLTSVLAGVISGIFGKTYSESLKTAKGLNAAAAAAGGMVKQNQLMGFDEINRIEDSDSSGGGAGGVVDGLSEAEGISNRIKGILSTIFDPFRQAWAAKGKSVIENAKSALSNMKELILDIGRSFAAVWANGTGLAVCSSLLEILSNIFLTISNIAIGLDEAWKSNDMGTGIVQKLFDLLVLVLGAIQEMSAATADWAAGLDFSPILAAFDGLLASLEPLTSTVCEALVWMYEQILLPFASWTIGDAIPAFLDLLASAIRAVNEVLEALQPLGSWLWDNFLQPIAAWTGGAICTILEDLAGWLDAIGSWISEHQGIMEAIATILGSIAAALGLVNAAVVIWNTVAGIASGVTAALGAAVAFLTSPIGIAVAIIGALIAVGVLLYKNWDAIKEKAGELKEAIAEKWSALKEKTFETWENIKTSVSDAMKGAKQEVSQRLGEMLSSWKNNLSEITAAVSSKFSDIRNKISEKINGAKSVVQEGVKAIKGFFNFTWKLPDIKLPHFHIDFDSSGIIGKAAAKLGLPGLPKIDVSWYARGGIIDQPTLAMMGEEGRKEAVVPLDRNLEWRDAIVDRISEKMGSGSGLSKEELYDVLYKVLEIMFEKYMHLYIGDEDLARHANRGNDLLNRRYGPQKA